MNIKTSAQYLHEYGDRKTYAEYRVTRLENAAYPPVVFKADGKSSTEFKWERKVGAIKTFTDYPIANPVKRNQRDDVWTCAELGLEITLEISDYAEFPLAEYLPVIRNLKQENSPVISDIKVIDTCLLAGAEDVTVYHNRGGAYRSNEYELLINNLSVKGENKFSLETVHGFPTDFSMPYFNIEDKANNRGVIAVLSWAGNWKTVFSVDNEGFAVCGGQYSVEFALLPGESVRAPEAIVLFYKGNWKNGMNLWRMWYYKHNVLRAQGMRMKTNLLYCISSDDRGMLNTEEENFASIERAAKGAFMDKIDFINQDAGWNDVEGRDNWTYVGNWYCDKERYPNGLRPVADLSHKYGKKYACWFEPERLCKYTETFRDAGKNALFVDVKPDGSVSFCDNDKLPPDAMGWLNFSDPETVDYITEKIVNFLQEQHIDQYRQDQNFGAGIDMYWKALDELKEKELNIPRKGISEAYFVVGYHRFWQAIIDRNNGMLIDSCSGGGRRNDVETVRQSFIHTRTDWYADDDDCQTQTYGMSMWYMLMGTAWMNPLDKYSNRSRLCSSYAFQPPCKENEAEFMKAYENWQNYMSMFFSVYYPLTPCDYSHEAIMAMQFEDIDNGRGMIPIYIRKSGTITVHPEGLCEDALYDVWEEDDGKKFTYSGRELAHRGITVSSDTRRSYMYFYERKN